MAKEDVKLLKTNVYLSILSHSTHCISLHDTTLFVVCRDSFHMASTSSPLLQLHCRPRFFHRNQVFTKKFTYQIQFKNYSSQSCIRE